MFIIKCARIRTRKIVGMHGQEVRQIPSDCLPRHALITTRKELDVCDKDNFLEWAKYVVKIVADLTVNGRKVCLVFDGYRSHMGFKVLRTLRDGGVVVYCLPTHTSSATQPLDVAVYSPFKTHLNNLIYSIAGTHSQVEYDQSTKRAKSN